MKEERRKKKEERKKQRKKEKEIKGRRKERKSSIMHSCNRSLASSLRPKPGARGCITLLAYVFPASRYTENLGKYTKAITGQIVYVYTSRRYLPNVRI